MVKQETETARFDAMGPVEAAWPMSPPASQPVENNAQPSSKSAPKENILQKVPPQVQKAVERIQRTHAYHKVEQTLQKALRWGQQTKTYRRLERTYAWKFIKNLKKDNRFWTWLGGIQAGSSHLWHAAIFIAALLSAPVVGELFGITACCALIGVGLLGISYGLPKAWRSLEEICAETFPKFNPARKLRIRAQHHAKKISEKPSVQKLQNHAGRQARRVAQHPLAKKIVEEPHVQKFLGSRLVSTFLHPTPRHQHMFLSAMTIEQAVTSTALYAVVAAALIGVASTGGLALVAAGLAYEVGTSVFSFRNGVKTLKQLLRDGKNEKEPVPASAHAVVPSRAMKALPLCVDRTSAFNRKAARTRFRESALKHATASHPPVRPSFPPAHRAPEKMRSCSMGQQG